MGNIPTTRDALFFPCSLVGSTPSGTALEAILVMLIELVLVARMASGRRSLAREPKMACFRGSDSETAYVNEINVGDCRCVISLPRRPCRRLADQSASQR